MLDPDIVSIIKRLTIAFVPLMLGIILHEVAHGWMANRRGDPTAALLGRLTLNPIPHIDPMGLLFFALTSAFGPVVLGWAKPVPINPRNFRNITSDIMAVSLAGPVTNFLLALISAGLLKVFLFLLPYSTWHTVPSWQFFLLMLYASITINCSLAWFNLMPIPPLDGSKVAWSFMPPRLGYRFMQLERYGLLIVFLLMFVGVFRFVLTPLVNGTTQLILTLFGL